MLFSIKKRMQTSIKEKKRKEMCVIGKIKSQFDGIGDCDFHGCLLDWLAAQKKIIATGNAAASKKILTKRQK